MHTPWCRIRCPYCAFYVETDAPRFDRWADAVCAQYDHEAPHFPGPAAHLYFGGGTPSLAPAAVLQRVVAHVDCTPDAEVTVEANPGTVDRAMLDRLVAAGINRVSVGIQTFQPQLARLLARAHTVADAAHLLSLVGQTPGLRSWSADLIFALPGQTLAQLADDLDHLIDSGAPHVSVYALSFEPGTPLTRARDLGRVVPLDADAWSEQYALVVDTLEGAGLERYEVSNFARPGHHARHNHHIWRAGHYMGLGPSAHGFRPDGTRTRTIADVSAWLTSPRSALEHPTAEEAATDFILSTLRHRDGVVLPVLHARTGYSVQRAALAPHIQRNLLCWEPHRLRLGTAGWALADGLVRAVVDALEPVRTQAPQHT